MATTSIVRGKIRPNFVPEGGENAAVKQTMGRRRPNFVLGKGVEPTPRVSREERALRHERAWEEAEATTQKRAADAKKIRWEEAVLQLKNRQESDLVRFLLDLPPAVREMYLLAEASHANRGAILQHFPAAGPTAREVWRDYAGSPVSTESEPKAQATPEADKPTSTSKGSK